MKIKHIFLFVFLCPIFLVMIVIGIQNVLLFFPIRIKPPIVGTAQSTMDVLGVYLTKYYEYTLESGSDINTSDAVSFLEGYQGYYSCVFYQEPASTFGSPLNYGVYLCLPKVLESERPTIIAYTEPIKEKRLYRVALFLNGNKMTAVVMDNYYLEKVLGLDKLEETPIPDFYLCQSTVKTPENRTTP